MKVQAAVFRYVDQRTKAGRFRGQTPRSVTYPLSRFAECCGEIEVSQLTKVHIRRWLEEEYARVGPSTLYQRFTMCAAFTKWLQAEGLLKTDPFYGLEPPKKPDALPRSLSQEQCEKLFANLPDLRAELICSLIFQSALRIAEVSRLEVGWIDFKDWTARVFGKGQKERVVPIFEETQPILSRYMIEFPARSGPLIRSYQHPQRGITPDRIGFLVSQWMYECGIKERPYDGVSAHAGRHTAATDTYEQSKDIRAVQQFLGHSSLQTTQRYVQSSAENIRLAGSGRKYRA